MITVRVNLLVSLASFLVRVAVRVTSVFTLLGSDYRTRYVCCGIRRGGGGGGRVIALLPDSQRNSNPVFSCRG